jgi:hypothetical protein
MIWLCHHLDPGNPEGFASVHTEDGEMVENRRW